MQDDGALCRTFRKALLESQLEFQVRIELPDLAPVICQWDRASQTAGVAAWVHETAIECVTVYLSGIDREEEAAAAQALLGSKPLPIALYRWHEVRDAHLAAPVSAGESINPIGRVAEVSGGGTR